MIVGNRGLPFGHGRAGITGKIQPGGRWIGATAAKEKIAGKDGAPLSGRPEHRASDAQIKGGLSKAKTGSSGGRTADHATPTRDPPGGTKPRSWTSALVSGAG